MPALIIDRIEGDMAVIEAGDAFFSIPVNVLPKGIEEGDRICITIKDGKTKSLKKAQDRLKRLSSNDAENDIIDL